MRKPQIITLLTVIALVILVYTGHIDVTSLDQPSASNGPISETALQSLSATSTQTYPVVRVVDGDTLVARIDGTDVTIRLIGINTPEVVDPRRPVECFGKEASEKAKTLLNGQSVRIVLDPTQGTYDKYWRLLAYVYLQSGQFFNKLMIEEGYAYEYTYHLPYQYQDEFKAAERDARAHERGLWAADTCGGDTGTASIIERLYFLYAAAFDSGTPCGDRRTFDATCNESTHSI